MYKKKDSIEQGYKKEKNRIEQGYKKEKNRIEQGYKNEIKIQIMYILKNLFNSLYIRCENMIRAAQLHCMVILLGGVMLIFRSVEVKINYYLEIFLIFVFFSYYEFDWYSTTKQYLILS